MKYFDNALCVLYVFIREKQKYDTDFAIKFNPKFIYLFGSYAKGEGREDSDIDLGIYTEQKLNSYELFMASSELSMILKKDVEIKALKICLQYLLSR